MSVHSQVKLYMWIHEYEHSHYATEHSHDATEHSHDATDQSMIQFFITTKSWFDAMIYIYIARERERIRAN